MSKLDIFQKKTYNVMSKRWQIKTARAVNKQVEKLSEKVSLQLRFLFMDLENAGPSLLIGQIMGS